FGMKARLITGYPGQNELLLALENGEVEAMSSPFWSSIKTSRPNWYPQAKIRFLFQYGTAPHPELKDVPFALDLLRNEADKALLIAASAPLGLGRPFVAPPGVPADRMAALRAAMTATFNDADFRADCEKQRLECNNPKTGAEIEALITQAYATPEDIRKRLIDIYQLGLGAENKKAGCARLELASRAELVVAIALRRIDVGRDGARGGTDDRARIAVRPHGLQERRIHAAVAAGRNRHGRDAAVDQLHGLDVVTALLLACCDRDVFPEPIGWAALGGAEPVRGFGVENVALLAYVDLGLEVRDLEMIVTLFDHPPECQVRRIAML